MDPVLPSVTMDIEIPVFRFLLLEGGFRMSFFPFLNAMHSRTKYCLLQAFWYSAYYIFGAPSTGGT